MKLHQITQDSFDRVRSDSNGNPRYAIHYTNFCLLESEEVSICADYANVVHIAKSVMPGSRKFHNRQYGGGIVIQSYNIHDEVDRVNCYNMSKFIQHVLNTSEAFKGNVVTAYKVKDKNMFEFVVQDNNDNFDDGVVTILLNKWDDERTIKHALANKSLIGFGEVEA